MRIPSRWLAVGLLCSLNAHALQRVEMTEGQTATIRVSTRDLTRIAFTDGGRIVRVWGLQDQMHVEPDRDGGQVFLRPAPHRKLRAFSFFIRDDQGTTHALRAVPTDMPAATILLQSQRRAPPRPAGTAPLHPTPYTTRIKALIRAMVSGTAPQAEEAAIEAREIALWAEAKLVLRARFAGELTGEVYELTNTSDNDLRLDERELTALGDDVRAVAIERHHLPAKQSTRLYVVRPGS